jgi:hypothetical protein
MTRVLVYLVVLGLLGAAAWAYDRGYYGAAAWPQNTFLFNPTDHYADLFGLLGPVGHGDPYAFMFANYPPFSYIVIYPLTWLGHDTALAVYGVLLVGGLGAFVWAQLRALATLDRVGCTLLLLLATYPMMFMVDRANVEAFVVLLLVLALWAIQKDRMVLAAIAIGAAGAMKGYPLVYALLCGRSGAGWASSSPRSSWPRSSRRSSTTSMSPRPGTVCRCGSTSTATST